MARSSADIVNISITRPIFQFVCTPIGRLDTHLLGRIQIIKQDDYRLTNFSVSLNYRKKKKNTVLIYKRNRNINTLDKFGFAIQLLKYPTKYLSVTNRTVGINIYHDEYINVTVIQTII